MMRFVTGLLAVIAVDNLALAQTNQTTTKASLENSQPISDFQAFEFRRYTIREGERVHFAQYFESYFPEAFQQLGAIAAGSFFERRNQFGFTWIRGFRTIEDLAVAT